MKKLLLMMSFIALALITSNCSSDSREEAPPEKQDFTNPNYIKSTIKGTWKLTHTNYNGVWSSVTALQGTTQYESSYKFSDNIYSYKPFTKPTDNSMDESGIYTISPATTSVNAKLNLSYTYNSQAKTRVVVLEKYENGVVEIAESSIVCPSGTCKERYQKQ